MSWIHYAVLWELAFVTLTSLHGYCVPFLLSGEQKGHGGSGCVIFGWEFQEAKKCRRFEVRQARLNVFFLIHACFSFFRKFIRSCTYLTGRHGCHISAVSEKTLITIANSSAGSSGASSFYWKRGGTSQRVRRHRPCGLERIWMAMNVCDHDMSKS